MLIEVRFNPSIRTDVRLTQGEEEIQLTLEQAEALVAQLQQRGIGVKGAPYG